MKVELDVSLTRATLAAAALAVGWRAGEMIYAEIHRRIFPRGIGREWP